MTCGGYTLTTQVDDRRHLTQEVVRYISHLDTDTDAASAAVCIARRRTRYKSGDCRRPVVHYWRGSSGRLGTLALTKRML